MQVTSVRASGPGGQNVNKVASKIELVFDVARTTTLADDVKARLRALAGSRIDAVGCLRITSQESRDRLKNLDTAREKLATLVRAALFVPKKRRPTRATKGSKERRLDGKKRDGEKKRARTTSGRDDGLSGDASRSPALKRSALSGSLGCGGDFLGTSAVRSPSHARRRPRSSESNVGSEHTSIFSDSEYPSAAGATT